MYSSSDLGAAAELEVAADLIRKGFDVFRNLSPNGPVDLIALRDGKTYRVQVKSRASMPQSFSAPDFNDCDVLAAVTPKGIGYIGGPFEMTRKQHRKKKCDACWAKGIITAYGPAVWRCNNWSVEGGKLCEFHLKYKEHDRAGLHGLYPEPDELRGLENADAA